MTSDVACNMVSMKPIELQPLCAVRCTYRNHNRLQTPERGRVSGLDDLEELWLIQKITDVEIIELRDLRKA